MAALNLFYLDEQVAAIEGILDCGAIPAEVRGAIATSIFNEVQSLRTETRNALRNNILISPETYIEEMQSFQRWMDFAHTEKANPFIVCAQVMTQLYVAFVWLRDSLMDPVGHALPGSTTAEIVLFLRSNERRRLRNAFAHGTWKYLQDFSGLECWDGRPAPTKFTVSAADLNAWQTLSRASTIAVLLALQDRAE